MMKVLVIDVGGSNVKFRVWQKRESRRFDSDPTLTASRAMKQVSSMTRDWNYDAVSVGFPGTVVHGRICGGWSNLGSGWVGFNFRKHFGKPVKVINDAAMQALGSYRGGRMLFLGLGTGLGSTLILDHVIIPLELGELVYSPKRKLGEVLGKRGLERMGAAAWERAVHHTVDHLARAFRTDSVVIGGGGVERLRRLPEGARRGDNDKAFVGGARLWGLAGTRVIARKHTWEIT